MSRSRKTLVVGDDIRDGPCRPARRRGSEPPADTAPDAGAASTRAAGGSGSRSECATQGRARRRNAWCGTSRGPTASAAGGDAIHPAGHECDGARSEASDGAPPPVARASRHSWTLPFPTRSPRGTPHARCANVRSPRRPPERDVVLGGTTGSRRDPATGIGACALDTDTDHVWARTTPCDARRLRTAMRSARPPAVKTGGDFDLSDQPSVARAPLANVRTLGFLERREDENFTIRHRAVDVRGSLYRPRHRASSRVGFTPRHRPRTATPGGGCATAQPRRRATGYDSPRPPPSHCRPSRSVALPAAIHGPRRSRRDARGSPAIGVHTRAVRVPRPARAVHDDRHWRPAV